MPYNETDNVWMVCSNCESNFSIEELFSEEEDNSIECPICNSHSFRKCDSYGLDIEDGYINEDYMELNYINSEW